MQYAQNCSAVILHIAHIVCLVIVRIKLESIVLISGISSVSNSCIYNSKEIYCLAFFFRTFLPLICIMQSIFVRWAQRLRVYTKLTWKTCEMVATLQTHPFVYFFPLDSLRSELNILSALCARSFLRRWKRMYKNENKMLNASPVNLLSAHWTLRTDNMLIGLWHAPCIFFVRSSNL